jgi:hypothetical protein
VVLVFGGVVIISTCFWHAVGLSMHPVTCPEHLQQMPAETTMHTGAPQFKAERDRLILERVAPFIAGPVLGLTLRPNSCASRKKHQTAAMRVCMPVCSGH